MASPALAGVPSPPRPQADLHFRHFVLQVSERRLQVGGVTVALQARAFDLLLALAERPGQLVLRQDLIERVWANRVVEDGNLNVQINALRKALGGDAIITIPGYGYRLEAEPAAPVAHTPAAAEPLSEPSAAPSAPSAAAGIAPAVAAPLVGREDDVQAVSELLDAHGLVTLTGGAGIGKTRLALAMLVGRRARHAQGTCFVDLAPLAEPAAVAAAIAAAVGVRPAAHENAAAALAEALAPLDLLLALDNAEHLIDAVAAVAAALGVRAPGVTVLVTSQASLHVAGEWVYRLGALALPAAPCSAAESLGFGAVALFDLRARAIDRHFRVTDANVKQVVELCRRLDGAPLAIELAAARAPLVGVGGILAALDRRLHILTGEARDAPPRHRTLRAALEWSHGLLAPAEQRVFRRLAVFEGSFSLSAAQQVLADADPRSSSTEASDGDGMVQVLDGLSVLIDRSLVTLAGVPDAPRFRLLDSPRALAWEQLRAAAEEPALRRRHALALQTLLDAAHAALLDGELGADDFADRLAPDLDNAHAALAWAVAHDATVAVTIAPVLSAALGRRRYSQGVALWQAVEPLLDDVATTVPTALRARALLQCAEHWQNTRIQHACQRATEAETLGLALRDDRLVYLAQRHLGYISLRAQDRPALLACTQRVRSLERPQWSPFVRVVGPSTEAWLCMLDGDHEGALLWCNQQAALTRASGASDTAVLVKVVGVQMLAGRIDECIASARELGERLSASVEQQQRCFALLNLSAALLVRRRPGEARAVLAESWPLCTRYGLQAEWADDAAFLAAQEGRPRAALRLLGSADAALAQVGRPREALDQLRADTARSLATEALASATTAAARTALGNEGACLSEAEVSAEGLAAHDR